VFSVKVSTKEELQLFSQVWKKYLSPVELEQLARVTEFVKRTSKYRGQDLVTLCVWLSHNLASTSLTQLCSELGAATEITMSPEGLNQRLNEKAVTFLQQLFARVILYRLTEVQVQKRRKDLAYKEKKKGVEYSEKSKRLTGINVYITNIAWEIVSKERVHDLYSLRWQIEIVCKTWKSFFQMDRCKEVKRERLECHLYGQLLAVLICSTTLFRMRELLLRKKQLELSEYKAFYIIQTYFPLFHQAIQQENTQAYTKILLRLFHLLEKNGRKSHRYEKRQSLTFWMLSMSIPQKGHSLFLKNKHS
jgi:hypothetical protein